MCRLLYLHYVNSNVGYHLSWINTVRFHFSRVPDFTIRFRFGCWKYIRKNRIEVLHTVSIRVIVCGLLTSRTREDVTAIVQSVDPGSGLERWTNIPPPVNSSVPAVHCPPRTLILIAASEPHNLNRRQLFLCKRCYCFCLVRYHKHNSIKTWDTGNDSISKSTKVHANVI